jgi:hypothetical protein
MAAGLGFKDFVTGEVLTAADVDGYLMQGVWVFASAAARDAAVTSPQEGNFAYLKDTNVTTYYTGSAWANLDTTGMTNPMTTTGDIIYSSPGSTPVRLGIGSTGNVLTVASGVPSWAAPASGASYTQISSQSLTGASVVNFSSISNTYNRLVMVFQDFYLGTNNENLVVRFNADSTANAYQLGATSGTSVINYSDNVANITYAGTANSDNNNAAVLFIENYSNTNSNKVAQYSSKYRLSATDYVDNGAIVWKNTNAIDAINVRTTAGTFSGGTAILWGVK